MSSVTTELYRTYKAAQERRAYFLIAAAGASIAFAVTQTTESVWVPSMWIWCAAIGFWALSFYCGLRHMAYVASSTFANMDLLKVEAGAHHMTGNNPHLMAAASEGIRNAMNTNSGRSALHARLQFGFLVAGGASFLTWHIIEIYMRVPKATLD